MEKELINPIKRVKFINPIIRFTKEQIQVVNDMLYAKDVQINQFKQQSDFALEQLDIIKSNSASSLTRASNAVKKFE